MNSVFAARLTKLRRERGMSQKDAAKMLGVSQSLLSHYEKGIRECSLDFVCRVAAAVSQSLGAAIVVDCLGARGFLPIFQTVFCDSASVFGHRVWLWDSHGVRRSAKPSACGGMVVIARQCVLDDCLRYGVRDGG